MPTLTYKTHLILDAESKSKLMEMLKAARFAWNECSKVKFEQVPKNSIVDLHKAFYREFRDAFPHIPSQVVIIAENSVISAFRSIRSSKHKIIRAPEKKKLSLQLDRNIFSQKDGIFSIVSLGSRVKCKPRLYHKLEELLAKHKFCDPLLFEKNGDIWISLTFKIPDPPPTQTLTCGVDLGLRVSAATSEGNLYIDKKFNGEKRRLRYLKRQLNSKSSKGSRSAKKRLAKLREKEQNKNRNFSHNLTKKILLDTKADVIAVENLKSIKVKKDKDQYKKQNRLSQVPLTQIREFLTYKAPIYGKTVIQVCPKYTSQIDHYSGLKDGERRGRRYYSSSGLIYDSDINAAINIGLRSKLPVSQAVGLTYGQAITNSPIVGKRKLSGKLQTG